METHVDHAKYLLNTPVTPKYWAQTRAWLQDNNESPSAELDAIERHYYLLLKYIREYDYDNNPGQDWEGLKPLEVLMRLYDFDRANALWFLRLKRDDTSIPRGVPWITNHALKASVGEWKEGWNSATSSYSYIKFAMLHNAPEDFMKALEKQNETEFPKWMVEKYNLQGE
jgi:hypothetical protein